LSFRYLRFFFLNSFAGITDSSAISFSALWKRFVQKKLESVFTSVFLCVVSRFCLQLQFVIYIYYYALIWQVEEKEIMYMKASSFFSQLHRKVVLVERKPRSSLTGTKFRPLVTILETKGILFSSFQTINFSGSDSLMACRTSQNPWLIRP
jgi:hypothetical protein